MNPSELALAQKNLSNRWWRLTHLYHIVDKRGQKVLFTPNWAQQELYKDLWYCNIILKARQLGISTFICLLFLDAALFNSNVTGGVIAHTREDAEYLFKRIKFAYDSLPDALKVARAATSDSARELCFNNGSSVRVGTSMRGATLQYLHISEFGKICAKYPDKAQEIITGSLNTLAPDQYVFIESTAEGREGSFYEICKKAQGMAAQGSELSKLDFKFHFFPWWKEPSYRMGSCAVMPQESLEYFTSLENRGIQLSADQKFWYTARQATQGDEMMREYPSTADEAWESAIDGSYYAKPISIARVEKRIGFIPYDESIPVYTAWDLGYNDSTAIWFAQFAGKEIHLIDYVEGSGESLAYWLGVVKSKPYVYEKHLAPHDIMAHEYTSGMTRQSSARKMGIHLVPSPKISIMQGIDLVRGILNRCWFDEAKCAQGIKCMENYKKEWDDRHGCWRSSPRHDWSSHGADAFRTLATGLPKSKTSVKTDQVALAYNPEFHPYVGSGPF